MNAQMTDRREFLRGLVRACLLGGLTLTGAVLLWRRWNQGACADTNRCTACGIHGLCPVRQQRDEAKS